MRGTAITAIILTIMFFQILKPEVSATLPSWSPLIVIALMFGLLMWLRSKLGITSTARQLSGKGDGVAEHEYAHGLAIKAGGGILKWMRVNNSGAGHTKFSNGKMTDGSAEWLRAIAAGREAQIVYLMNNYGYSRSGAESAVRSCDDDELMHSYASRGDVTKARKAARQFVRKNYWQIERGGRRLARKGKMTSL